MPLTYSHKLSVYVETPNHKNHIALFQWFSQMLLAPAWHTILQVNLSLKMTVTH